MLPAFFAVLVFIALALKLWTARNENQNESAISIESKNDMANFMTAILIDNPKNERVIGLTETDIIEIYEQSIEVIAFQEEVSSLILKFLKIL